MTADGAVAAEHSSARGKLAPAETSATETAAAAAGDSTAGEPAPWTAAAIAPDLPFSRLAGGAEARQALSTNSI